MIVQVLEEIRYFWLFIMNCRVNYLIDFVALWNETEAKQTQWCSAPVVWLGLNKRLVICD